MEFLCHIDQSGILIDALNVKYLMYDISQTDMGSDMVLTTCKMIDRNL